MTRPMLLPGVRCSALARSSALCWRTGSRPRHFSPPASWSTKPPVLAASTPLPNGVPVGVAMPFPKVLFVSVRGARTRMTSWLTSPRHSIPHVKKGGRRMQRTSSMTRTSDKPSWYRGGKSLVAALIAACYLLAGSPAAAAPPAGEMRWALYVTFPPAWLDPAEVAVAGVTPFWVIYALHDALLKPMPGNPMAPSLAELWTVSPDQKVYEFKLREGLKFHND